MQSGLQPNTLLNSTLNGSAVLTAGTEVIYGLHGRCTVISVESKNVGGTDLNFYRLEIQRPIPSRTTKLGPTIWLPVTSAKEQGIRKPMDFNEAEMTLIILESREFYFQLEEPWKTLFPKLEVCIRKEGGVGLAKVESFLFVLKNKIVVPSTEILRFSELVTRLLLRELSQALNEPIKSLEERIQKLMKGKLQTDS